MPEKKKKASITPSKSKPAAKQPSKPTITKVANALEDAVGRIGNKVKSITGSARDTIVTQIDTAIKNRKDDLAKEMELNKKRELVSDAKSTSAYRRSVSLKDSSPSLLGRLYGEDSINAIGARNTAKVELKNLQAAESQWNKFKGSIGYRGKPKAKKK
jgi:acyl-CoA reductase-like NAD-dependent aldehyde dehydrogenase